MPRPTSCASASGWRSSCASSRRPTASLPPESVGPGGAIGPRCLRGLHRQRAVHGPQTQADRDRPAGDESADQQRRREPEHQPAGAGGRVPSEQQLLGCPAQRHRPDDEARRRHAQHQGRHGGRGQRGRGAGPADQQVRRPEGRGELDARPADQRDPEQVALICGAGIEFATTFWAPDLLVSRTGASSSLSSAAVSALVLGMAASRFVVGPMSLRRAPEKLLLAGYATAGAGWLVFWFATSPLVAMAGLVVAGLGYGTHFPLAVSLVLRASAGRPDQAQARATLGAGAAIGVAPFALGALADAFGPHRAFLLVGALIACGAIAVSLGLRSVHRTLAVQAAQAARSDRAAS